MTMSDTPAPVDLTNPNQLLTIEEFCAWVGVPKRTFRQWCQDGTAPKRSKVGRHIRIRVNDALTWYESRSVS